MQVHYETHIERISLYERDGEFDKRLVHTAEDTKMHSNILFVA